MDINLYRECELKYKIENDEIKSEKTILILKNGYNFSGEVIETDFIFDTKEYLCKKSHLLFRVRKENNLENNNSFILFTLKIKGISDNFQDNYEIEINSRNPCIYNMKLLIYELQKRIGIKLLEKVFLEKSIKNILLYLQVSGFLEYSIMQKKRSYFIGANSLITFDVFPDPMGTYLEIEATNENDLYKVVEMLKLDKMNMEKKNYGQLILNRNKMIVFNDKNIFL